jgi:hypothetical protein
MEQAAALVEAARRRGRRLRIDSPQNMNETMMR